MKAVPVTKEMSILQELAERDRLHREADKKLPVLATHLQSLIPRRLDLFRKHHRWEGDTDWQFPLFIDSIVSRSRTNLAIESVVQRHLLPSLGFKNYRTFCYHLDKLARAWKGNIDIRISFFTSDDKRVSERAFNKSGDDVSAYMKISFYATEFLNHSTSP